MDVPHLGREDAAVKEHYPVLNWQDVKKIIDEGSLEKLGRSNDQQKKYNEFCNQLRVDWESVTDYILVSKLNFKCIISNHGKKVAERSPIVETRTVISKNDFSYNFEGGIVHYVIWKTGSDIHSDEIIDAAHDLKSALNATDFITYTNPPHLKSILNLEHAHILLSIGT